MSRFIIAAFAFMVLFSVVTADKCPEDEVYRECGSACPPTCQEPCPKVCTMQCVPGCFCKAGLVRDSNGECVTLDECSCLK